MIWKHQAIKVWSKSDGDDNEIIRLSFPRGTLCMTKDEAKLVAGQILSEVHKIERPDDCMCAMCMPMPLEDSNEELAPVPCMPEKD